jgi:Fe2+ or Zn2+ uptake regulation protein
MQTAPTIDDIRDRLRGAGMAATTQRLAVARFVLTARSHPTAKEVLEEVRAQAPTVSQATVYNTLNKLVEAGLVVALRGGHDDSVRYDGNTEPHHHLLDTVSSRPIDIPFDDIEIANIEELQRKYQIDRITVTIEGQRR